MCPSELYAKLTPRMWEYQSTSSRLESFTHSHRTSPMRLFNIKFLVKLFVRHTLNTYSTYSNDVCVQQDMKLPHWSWSTKFRWILAEGSGIDLPASPEDKYCHSQWHWVWKSLNSLSNSALTKAKGNLHADSYHLGSPPCKIQICGRNGDSEFGDADTARTRSFRCRGDHFVSCSPTSYLNGN